MSPSDNPLVIDERFNQLDELDSQLSQSILSNCGPGGAPPGGELVIDNQIQNDSVSDNASNVSNVSNSNSSSIVSNVSSLNDNSVNCYGSSVAPVVTPPGPPTLVDGEMVQASDPCK